MESRVLPAATDVKRQGCTGKHTCVRAKHECDLPSIAASALRLHSPLCGGLRQDAHVSVTYFAKIQILFTERAWQVLFPHNLTHRVPQQITKLATVKKGQHRNGEYCKGESPPFVGEGAKPMERDEQCCCLPDHVCDYLAPHHVMTPLD
jgi:hypothetical protein